MLLEISTAQRTIQIAYAFAQPRWTVIELSIEVPGTLPLEHIRRVRRIVDDQAPNPTTGSACVECERNQAQVVFRRCIEQLLFALEPVVIGLSLRDENGIIARAGIQDATTEDRERLEAMVRSMLAPDRVTARAKTSSVCH